MWSIVRIRAGDKLTEAIEELRWKDSNEVFEMLLEVQYFDHSHRKNEKLTSSRSESMT